MCACRAPVVSASCSRWWRILPASASIRANRCGRCVIENYNGGSALITRIHHCIADGIALIGVLLNMTDEDPQAPDTPRGAGSRQIEGQKFNKGATGATSILRRLELANSCRACWPGHAGVGPRRGVAQQAFDQLGP